MNQMELNNIATIYIQNKSIEITTKLLDVLKEDIKDSVSELGGATLQHIHNMALLRLLLCINGMQLLDNPSEDEVRQFLEFVETMRPRFWDMVEAVNDFMPTKHDCNEN